jgi:fatty-acyl-CoA synthase
MKALMMKTPLLIRSLMRHALEQHPSREVVSVTADQPRHRYSYRDAFGRAAQLAHALRALGVGPSERIGTLAWNDFRHFELYYAVSCAGYVLHTINPRLFPDQLRYIIDHAEDAYVFLDPMFVPLVENLAPSLRSPRGYVVLAPRSHVPKTALPNVLCYEELLAGHPVLYPWPELDEDEASALCYTSGTTGNPKGVLYSHRSTVLHAYATALPDVLGLRARDVVLPVVPMFHANAWGTVYAAPLTGAKLVLPGAKAGDPATLTALMESEGVTAALGVPTVWLGLLQYLDAQGTKLSTLERTLVGGSAVPLSIIESFRERYGVDTRQGWGMTETGPIGSTCTLKHYQEQLPDAEQKKLRVKQGRAVFGVEWEIVDEEGRPLPHDGKAYGALRVRGPWVASGYFKCTESPAHCEGGWFDTGDVATIDPDGFMQITDRAKDVIKSGGEWISSIDIENAAMGHPGVAEAAVIGVAHPKWAERPLLIVVKRPGHEFGAQDVLEFLKGRIAKWWMPDAVVFTDAIPHTATGKISKLQLRAQYAGFDLQAQR